MGDGFEGLRQGHTTHGCAIIEQRGEVEPNPLWHRVLSFVMVGREFYSISPLLRNACENEGPDILLLGMLPSKAGRGESSWTPPPHSAPIWRALPDDKQARVTFASTRARTSASCARSATRRLAQRQAQLCIACGPLLRRSAWW